MSGTQDVKDLLAKKEAILQGDPTRVAKQRALGKLTARERVSKLLDQGSFVELDTLVRSGEAGAGVITGYGMVEDRPVYVFSQDFTVRGGAMGKAQGKKLKRYWSWQERLARRWSPCWTAQASAWMKA